MGLREARKNARYTQQQVAEIMGYTRPTIARMERHPEDVTISDAIRLAELYGVSFDDLFFVTKNCN